MDTVIRSEKVKDWVKDGVSKPIYGVWLSDGRSGQSFSLIPVGTPISELSFETNQYGLKIKMNKSNNSNYSGGGGSKRSGNESFALSYAKDIVVAGKTDLKLIWELADKMYDWLEKKSKQPQQTQTSVNQPINPITIDHYRTVKTWNEKLSSPNSNNIEEYNPKFNQQITPTESDDLPF